MKTPETFPKHCELCEEKLSWKFIEHYGLFPHYYCSNDCFKAWLYAWRIKEVFENGWE